MSKGNQSKMTLTPITRKKITPNLKDIKLSGKTLPFGSEGKQLRLTPN